MKAKRMSAIISLLLISVLTTGFPREKYLGLQGTFHERMHEKHESFLHIRWEFGTASRSSGSLLMHGSSARRPHSSEEEKSNS